jgi:hypothetical protein
VYVLFLLYSLENEGATCYMLSTVQCLSGLTGFCLDVREEKQFSPLLTCLDEILLAREAGDLKKMNEATVNLRLVIGCAFFQGCLDELSQQDAHEVLTLFLQYAKQEILSQRPGYPTCVDTSFRMGLEVTKICREKYGTLFEQYVFFKLDLMNLYYSPSCKMAGTLRKEVFFHYLYVVDRRPKPSVAKMLLKTPEAGLPCSTCKDEGREETRMIVDLPR